MRVHISILLLLTTFVAACAAVHEAVNPPDDPLPSTSGSPPALLNIPWPDDTHITSGVTTDIEALGREIYKRSQDAYNDGDSEILPAASGVLTWAMYRFQTGAYAFDRINFEVTDVTTPQKLWIGVSDYQKGAWSWTMYTSGMSYLAVNWSTTRSPSGYAYIVIATYDFATARVLRSFVQVEMPTWDVHIVDDLNSPGSTCAMARLQNFAGIVYEREDGIGGYQLRLAKATVFRPTDVINWDYRYIEDTYPEPVPSLEMVGVGNTPAFAVAHQGSGLDDTEVWYYHGKNALPADSTEWHQSLLGLGRDGDSLGLALIDGYPAVAFEDAGGSGGRIVTYKRAIKAAPESGADWQEVAAGLDFSPTQDYRGLFLYDRGNLPVLLFFDYSIGILRMATSQFAMPLLTSDFTFASIDEAGVGEVNTGIEFGGRAVAVYVDPVVGEVRYARSKGDYPSSPGDFYQRHVIDNGAAAPSFYGDVDITRLDTGMGIAYRDFATGAIMYAWDDGGTPGSGSAWKISMVDPGPTSGNIEVIQMQDGTPGICYHTDSPSALMFAQMVP